MKGTSYHKIGGYPAAKIAVRGDKISRDGESVSTIFNFFLAHVTLKCASHHHINRYSSPKGNSSMSKKYTREACNRAKIFKFI